MIPTGRDRFHKAFPEPGCCRQVIAAWIHELRAVQVGVVRPRTYEVRCADGTDKTIRFRPVMMQDGDQFVGYEEITERRRLEAYLQQAQKMEAIGTLAGKILAIRPDIPIILCTGCSEQITEKRTGDLGIQAFAIKPLVMMDLADTIRKVLDKAG